MRSMTSAVLHPTAGEIAARPRVSIPAADILPVSRRATPAYRLARPVLRAVYRLLFKVRVHGRGNIPADGCVVISNHLQWIDCVAVLDALPAEPRVHALGDPSDIIRKGGALWWLLRQVGGIIPIDRGRHGDTVLFDHVQRCLESGASALIFPEGRCSDAEAAMLPFKKGFAHFALRAGRPVLPVAITGTRDLWLRSRIDVVIGKPIDTTGMSADELTELGRAHVAALQLPYRARRGPRLLRRLTRLF